MSNENGAYHYKDRLESAGAARPVSNKAITVDGMLLAVWVFDLCGIEVRIIPGVDRNPFVQEFNKNEFDKVREIVDALEVCP